MGYPAASSSQQNFEDLRSLQGQADSMRDEAQVRSHSCSVPHPLHPFSALGFFVWYGKANLVSFAIVGGDRPGSEEAGAVGHVSKSGSD